jgi:hypothetical protein
VQLNCVHGALVCWLQGVSWHLGYAASGCISAGLIPPCVCIAIDSAGPYRCDYTPCSLQVFAQLPCLAAGSIECKLSAAASRATGSDHITYQVRSLLTYQMSPPCTCRSYTYLPFPPGTGEGGFRGDAARWPGGGAHDFLMRLTHELLPMLQQRYGLAQVRCFIAAVPPLQRSEWSRHTCLLSTAFGYICLRVRSLHTHMPCAASAGVTQWHGRKRLDYSTAHLHVQDKLIILASTAICVNGYRTLPGWRLVAAPLPA